MRRGHHEAQVVFERLGYRCRRTWTREHPTDGVWLLDTPHLALDQLPVAALEVVVTETGKALRGSISTWKWSHRHLGSCSSRTVRSAVASSPPGRALKPPPTTSADSSPPPRPTSHGPASASPGGPSANSTVAATSPSTSPPDSNTGGKQPP